MEIELRDYQKECLLQLEKPIKKQLIQLPTGAGKTIVFLSYLRKYSSCALIVVPTLDLQQQIYDSALNFYSENEIFMKERQKFRQAKIYILVAASLRNEETLNALASMHLDHVIIDEAHKALAQTYTSCIDFFTNSGLTFKLIGFTATPERSDKKCLLNLFGSITYKKTIYELIESGFLCNLECFRIKTKNVIEHVGKTGDFRNVDIKHLDNYSRNSLIYKTYFENCTHKKTLIFCISIDHAEKMADYLRKEKGISAHHISGLQSISHRQDILKKFRNGEISVLTNCQLLCEGFDEPSIEAIIIARPTRSKALYCQMLGRGTRLYPGKTICSVYELTDNAHKICTFNVIADENKDENFHRDYINGITLTQLHKEIKEISLTNYLLEKEEIDVIGDFKGFLESKGITEIQKKKLCMKSIDYLEKETNFLQANFLIFLHNLKVKYGYS